MKYNTDSKRLGGIWDTKKKSKQDKKTKRCEKITLVAHLGDLRCSHVPLVSPSDDPAHLCLRWEKGNGRRIYCWVLTCTHSWCCFSPLGPSAIPKASKTTGCQVVTAGFKQLLQQPCTQVPSRICICVCVCGWLCAWACVRWWLSVCLVCTCRCIAACVGGCVYLPLWDK